MKKTPSTTACRRPADRCWCCCRWARSPARSSRDTPAGCARHPGVPGCSGQGGRLVSSEACTSGRHNRRVRKEAATARFPHASNLHQQPATPLRSSHRTHLQQGRHGWAGQELLQLLRLLEASQQHKVRLPLLRACRLAAATGALLAAACGVLLCRVTGSIAALHCPIGGGNRQLLRERQKLLGIIAAAIALRVQKRGEGWRHGGLGREGVLTLLLAGSMAAAGQQEGRPVASHGGAAGPSQLPANRRTAPTDTE